MKLNRTGSLWDRNQRNGINENWEIIEGDYRNIVDNVSEKAYQQVVDSAKLDWKEPVNSHSNLPSSATKGDTRMTRDTGKVYRYSGTAWQEIQQIDASPLNELDSRISSQLAQTATKEDLSLKTDITTTNELKNEIRNAKSGSPKGVFETLSDLETSLPVGDDGTYLVRENNYWYYWNELIDNLFTKETVTVGKYLIDGVPTEGQSSSAFSDYIAVVPNDSYWITRVLETDGGGFYDQNKNYAGKIVGDGSNKLVIPENIYYIRLNITPSSNPLASFVVKQGSVNVGKWSVGGTYQSTGVGIEEVTPSNIDTNFLNRIFSLDKNKKIRRELLFDTPQLNIFNKNTVTMGYFLIQGVPTLSQPQNSYSDYIPVTPNSILTATRILESDGGSFYDSNLNYVTNFQGNNNQINIPADVYYIRLNINTGASSYNLDNFMVVNGDQLPDSYHSYGVGKIEGLQVESESIKPLLGKKTLTIGTSITSLDGKTQSAYDGGNTVIVGYQGQLRLEGAIVTNMGHSGATIAKYTETDTGTHGSLYDDIVENGYDVSPFDIIILEVGTNDVLYKEGEYGVVGSYEDTNFDLTTTLGSLRGLLEYILINNPTAKIYVFAPFYSSAQARTRERMLDINDKMNRVCELYNVPCIQMYTKLGINKFNYTNYLYDTTHPNNEGMEWLGKFMVHNIVK